MGDMVLTAPTLMTWEMLSRIQQYNKYPEPLPSPIQTIYANLQKFDPNIVILPPQPSSIAGVVIGPGGGGTGVIISISGAVTAPVLNQYPITIAVSPTPSSTNIENITIYVNLFLNGAPFGIKDLSLGAFPLSQTQPPPSIINVTPPGPPGYAQLQYFFYAVDQNLNKSNTIGPVMFT